VVGWQVVFAALQIVAWCVVAKDKMPAAGVNVHVGEPDMVAVLFVPASVIVIVHGADVDNDTVELVNARLLGIVAPASVIFPTE
jgi:hypothetical protein